jgi:hypothetical protein
MNTSRSGLSSDCWSRQTALAAATSGRSCSAACCVFFSRQAFGGEEPADRRRADVDRFGRQTAAQLGDCEIRLAPQHGVHALGMARQDRTLPATVPLRLDGALSPPALHELDHEADADLEPARRRPPRQAGLDRRTTRPRKSTEYGHVIHRWPPYPSSQLESQHPPVVNPSSIPSIRIPL